AYGWPEDAEFLVPDEVREHFAAGSGRRGQRLRTEGEAMFERYLQDEPALADERERMQRRALPADWDAEIPTFAEPGEPLATRKASQQVLNAIARRVPWLLVGSADLTGSTAVRLEGEAAFGPS